MINTSKMVMRRENGKGRSSYSDAVIIMSQYKTACDEFRLKYFNKGWDHLW